MSAPAVVDGQLLHVSPSQIKDYLRCPRYWYFKKVLHMKEPDGPGTALGSDVHKVIEDSFLQPDPKPIPKLDPHHPSYIAYLSAERAQALPDVPRPHETVLIEVPRDYNMGLFVDGVRVKARIDLLHTFEDKLPQVEVIDWKTRGSNNFETTESLTYDPQSIIYQKFALDNLPECERSRFGHVYILTKRVHAKAVFTDWASREEVDENYESLIVSTVQDMKRDAKAQLEDVPTNTKSCFLYRKPCPFATSCSANKAHKEEHEDPFHGFDDL